MKERGVGVEWREMSANDVETTILRAIGRSYQPLSAARVDALGCTRSRRTTQRILHGMVDRGLLERVGRTRATSYQLTEAGKAILREASPRLVPDFEPDLAGPFLLREEPETYREPDDELRALRERIRKPMAERTPVGYTRAFLEAYEPNKTRYLPEALREELHRLGQSEHMAALPPGTYARHVLDRLLIDLSWNSCRLEGNTYSLLETDHLLRLGKTEDFQRARDAQMILNHKGAVEFLVEDPMDLGFNRYTFLNLHAILTEGLLKNPAAEGRLRDVPVGVGGTVYHPVSTPSVLEECFDLILEKVALIENGLEQAFFLMVHLPYLQPFEDGNKRMSRVSANLPLIQNNLAPLSFVDVSVRDYVDGILAVYELNRVDLLRQVFAEAYRKSAGRYANLRQELGEPDPFALRYRSEIKERIRHVVVRQMDKLEAADHLRQWAGREVTASDQARFVELVEAQLLQLHEGNLARVRLRPSEFAAWQPRWSGQWSE